MSKVYAIVGGGTSGMTVLGQLVNRLVENKDSSKEQVKIVIYEKDKSNIATGMPYNIHSSTAFLLNGPPAQRLKLLPGGKTLQEWMQETYESWKKNFQILSKMINFLLVPWWVIISRTNMKI